MGAGFQQPTMQQGGEASSLADVFKVLYEPTAVFERVRERPTFLMPFLVICVVQLAVFFFNMPFMKAGMAAQMATRPAGGPDPSKFLWIGAIFVPLGIGLILVIAGGLLWVVGVTLLGYALGKNIPNAKDHLLVIEGIIIALSHVPVGLEVLRSRRSASSRS